MTLRYIIHIYLGSNLSLLKEIRSMEEYIQSIQAEQTPIEDIVAESWLSDADKFLDNSDSAILKDLMSNRDFQQSNAMHDRVKEQYCKFQELYDKSNPSTFDATKLSSKS